jgi:hypothetical protein
VSNQELAPFFLRPSSPTILDAELSLFIPFLLLNERELIAIFTQVVWMHLAISISLRRQGALMAQAQNFRSLLTPSYKTAKTTLEYFSDLERFERVL